MADVAAALAPDIDHAHHAAVIELIDADQTPTGPQLTTECADDSQGPPRRVLAGRS
jgi:hypothetical protein